MPETTTDPLAELIDLAAEGLAMLTEFEETQ